MSMCALCGFEMIGAEGLCPHHLASVEESWAVANRIMCDFVHRGKTPPRLPEPERDLLTA
jgi:hypothetical protein